VRTSSRDARAAVLVLALFACNDGLQPEPACPNAICGRVTFQGTVPDSTDAVYIVAYQTFPRSRNDLFTFQPSLAALQALPLDSASAPYSVLLPTGRYEWVVAVWKKVGALTIANADSMLREAGYYRDPADTSQPRVVTVAAQGLDSINFVIDFAHMNPPCRYYNPPCP
jgi:hypothetical protein